MILRMIPSVRWLWLMLYLETEISERVFMSGADDIHIQWEAMAAGLPNGFVVIIPYPIIHLVTGQLCV